MRDMVILACESAGVVITQPQKINAARLIVLNLRSIVVFVDSILRTAKRGSITGG